MKTNCRLLSRANQKLRIQKRLPQLPWTVHLVTLYKIISRAVLSSALLESWTRCCQGTPPDRFRLLASNAVLKLATRPRNSMRIMKQTKEGPGLFVKLPTQRRELLERVLNFRTWIQPHLPPFLCLQSYNGLRRHLELLLCTTNS